MIHNGIEYITYLPIFVVPPPIPKKINVIGINISILFFFLSVNNKYKYGLMEKIIGNSALEIPLL